MYKITMDNKENMKSCGKIFEPRASTVTSWASADASFFSYSHRRYI